MFKQKVLSQSSLKILEASPSVELARYVITLIVGAVIGVVVQGIIEAKLRESWVYVLVLVMVCLLGLVIMVGRLMKKLSEIGRRIGLSVRYVAREKSRAILFRELRNIIKQARKRIIIVNTAMMHSSEEDDDVETVKERGLYFEALLERARNGVSYHRIIQAGDMTSLKDLGKERLRHFHSMISEKEEHGHTVGLTRVADTRPLTFTLIDDRWLMMQIDQRDKRGLHMEAILIFDDPEQAIVRDFEKFYQAINLSPTGSIEKGDLLPLEDEAPTPII